jgi:hypothetical protein
VTAVFIIFLLISLATAYNKALKRVLAVKAVAGDQGVVAAHGRARTAFTFRLFAYYIT